MGTVGHVGADTDGLLILLACLTVMVAVLVAVLRR